MSLRRMCECSIERLNEMLKYDALTGEFRWSHSALVNASRRGKITNPRSRGRYLSIVINKQNFQAHRIAWAMMTSKWPEVLIDHIDGDGRNNAFCNLRLADDSQNAMNKTTPKGFAFEQRSQRYRATIKVRGKDIHLGYFKTSDEARSAYEAGRDKYFGDYSPAVRGGQKTGASLPSATSSPGAQ